MDAGEEFRAVGGTAAGLGGDGREPLELPRREPGGAGGERADRPIHGRCPQRAGPFEVFAEADHATEAVEHGESAAGWRADEQAAIVGPEVEGGEGRPGGAADRRGQAGGSEGFGHGRVPA